MSYCTIADVDDHGCFCDVLHDVESAPERFEEHLEKHQRCRHNLDLRYHGKIDQQWLVRSLVVRVAAERLYLLKVKRTSS